MDAPSPWIPWMRRALQLAALGSGRTSPNPLVGAVVLGLPFLWMAWKLWRGDRDRPWAAITFHYSLAYLALLFVVVAVDAAA